MNINDYNKNTYRYTMCKLNELEEQRQKERRKEELKLAFLKSLIVTLVAWMLGKLLFRK